MANSSDWVSTLAEQLLDASPPQWLGEVSAASEFVAGFPAGEDAGSEPLPLANDDPDILPTAEPPREDDAANALEHAFQEGVAAGEAKATEANEARIAEITEQYRRIRSSFRALDKAAIDCLAGELTDTVVALCEGVIDGLKFDREDLIRRCNDAVRHIGSAAEKVSLHLNPEDIELLGDGAFGELRMVSDSGVSRGSLVLESDDGTVSDGPDQWRELIAAAVKR